MAQPRGERVHRPSRSKKLKLGLGGLTSWVRVMPDTLIVGAQRCGTSSLFRYLARHPRVLKGLRKEVDFFNRFGEPGFDEAWYRSHFPTSWTVAVAAGVRGGPVRVLEASPNYLWYAPSFRTMRETLPDARLIVMLRDPVERAHSHYRKNLAGGSRPAAFESCVERGIAWASEGVLDADRFVRRGGRGEEVVARGLYAPQLEAVFRHFPREQVHVLRSEDLYGDPHGTTQQVLGFLGLPPHRLPAYPVRNRKPGPALEPGIERRLRRFFRPHNERLYELLGRDFGWPVA